MVDGIDIDMSQVEALAVALVEAGPAMAVTAAKIVAVEAEMVRAEASARAPVLTGAQAAGYYVEDAGEADLQRCPRGVLQRVRDVGHGTATCAAPRRGCE